MSKIKACIFDLDGVIVDTAVYHYEAWRRLANQLGFDFTEEQNEQLKGISRIESLKIILNWGTVAKTDEEMQELATLKNTWYVEMIKKMTPSDILPGAKEFLEAVRANKYLTALGSASKNSEMILKQIGLMHLFDALVDGNKVTKSKPNPEVFLVGAKELNVNPGECVVFEDAIAGVQAAKAGNMKAVGIGEAAILNEADLVVKGLFEMTIEKLENL
ncbi:beta-phosphoglucomutase [Pedobacter frigiditerrae]|uniref:Beta-phosphoglucomutase n=1 Tax=Pedobacter frigiditerrae TaxID=2530452 RepID=A0A4R0MY26_9SPHI|nr:beta-phosphoglucomutase [Pedobacter frigiditerrae]TCC92208.1 beta-phosphoglucomutase [Pedobacter frigiditerrae]